MNFGLMWVAPEELKIPRHLYETVVGVAFVEIILATMIGKRKKRISE